MSAMRKYHQSHLFVVNMWPIVKFLLKSRHSAEAKGLRSCKTLNYAILHDKMNTEPNFEILDSSQQP